MTWRNKTAENPREKHDIFVVGGVQGNLRAGRSNKEGPESGKDKAGLMLDYGTNGDLAEIEVPVLGLQSKRPVLPG